VQHHAEVDVDLRARCQLDLKVLAVDRQRPAVAERRGCERVLAEAAGLDDERARLQNVCRNEADVDRVGGDLVHQRRHVVRQSGFVLRRVEVEDARVEQPAVVLSAATVGVRARRAW